MGYINRRIRWFKEFWQKLRTGPYWRAKEMTMGEKEKKEHPEHPHGAPPGQAKPEGSPVPKPDQDLPEEQPHPDNTLPGDLPPDEASQR